MGNMLDDPIYADLLVMQNGDGESESVRAGLSKYMMLLTFPPKL